MPRHDVAIYMPYARAFYDGTTEHTGGGAERQTWLLARSLALRGARVAHIVYPIPAAAVDPEAPVTLVQRPHIDGARGVRDFAGEAREVWRALTSADAAVQVVRGVGASLGVAAAWARRHRRRVVFAGASNADFTLETTGARIDPRVVLYRAGVTAADAVVVQSGDQARLARERFPKLARVEEIPSFVEPAPEAQPHGEAFLWVSRLSSYKRPLLYADLAAALPEARFWMVPSQSPEPEFSLTLAELHRRARESPNLEILPPRRHDELQLLVGRAVAMVNTSQFEGMPNTWLEGWARGVPALSLSVDPDQRIARRGLGVSAGGSWDGFVAGARELWAERSRRGGYGPTVREYVSAVHGTAVADRWAELLLEPPRG